MQSLPSSWMGALHLDTYWSSEEEETNEIMSISIDRYYLTLGTAVRSFPCVCAPNAVQLEEGQASALDIRQPPQVSGSTITPNSTRKSMLACAAALLQNLNELCG